ncbi:alpha/beta fold hydrolase [Micromonospora musae]|uniref:alpha/beta fold hydrolase n=1 Tax=Micromonospora musae TaxID=1894970 RepID=UPI00341E9910
MTVVFVHGVPETPRVWADLRAQLTVPSVALSLPGFGNPLPSGFDPDKDGYAGWLADELQRLDGPIDLVGHDWGALLVLRIATTAQVPLRSWVVDVASVYHPGYVWHPWATSLWEAGAGEEVLAARRAAGPDDPAGSVAFQTGLGVPREAAVEMAAAHDEVMSRAILGLYRSAAPNVSADWGAEATTPTPSPGLVVIATGDAVEDEPRAREMAQRLGARVARFEGRTHWWMFDPSGTVARTLEDFWRSVDGA